MLDSRERILMEYDLRNISPTDAKYKSASKDLADYLSADAEWKCCAQIQKVLLETRKEFGQAEQWNVDEVEKALPKLSSLNMSLLESKVTKHDQLAVLMEMARYISPETLALLHPGTTSYDIMDTAKSCLVKKAWKGVIRPEVSKSVGILCDLSEKSKDILQVGRTHLQVTSPVPLDLTLSQYAGRIGNRVERIDYYVDDLRGKISGIVGTGASIEMVLGKDKSIEFENAVLKKLDLKPDRTGTQIVQKERLADVGHGITTLSHVLGNIANDMRILYSSEINEVTSRSNAERLGGSSADAMKNNPINYENIAATPAMVEGGMRVLYELIETNLQRDLRSSKEARYQPAQMMAETYESFQRFNKSCLPNLSFNLDNIARNLEPVRNNPSEAMVAILRGEKWIHSKYGVGHDFVKEMGKKAKKENRRLLDVSLEDKEFMKVFKTLPGEKIRILNGELELYIGSAHERAKENVEYARKVIGS